MPSGEAWDAALSVEGLAAIGSVGFEPAGQVFGAVAYYLTTVAGVSCPGTTAAAYQGRGASLAGTDLDGAAGRLGQRLLAGRQTALDRMAGQCAERGGHGVVAVALRVTEVPATSLSAAVIEFTAAGTAVRAAGCPPLARPFASELSGPDVAKLMAAGWAPAGIALGVAVAGLHDELVTTSSGPWGTGNAEVPGYTGLVGAARAGARDRLGQSVLALGADGVVVSDLDFRVRGDRCQAGAAATDYFAEAVVTGTAVARIGGRGADRPRPSLAVLHLNDRDAGPDDRAAPGKALERLGDR